MDYTIKLTEKEYKFLQLKLNKAQEELDKRGKLLDSLVQMANILEDAKEVEGYEQAMKDAKDFKDTHNTLKEVIKAINNPVNTTIFDVDKLRERQSTLENLQKQGITPIDTEGKPYKIGGISYRDTIIALLDKDKFNSIFGSLYMLKGIILDRSKSSEGIDKDIAYLYSIVKHLS